MVTIYGRGILPFNDPTADSSKDEGRDRTLRVPPVEKHKWGVVEPGHFDFQFGTEVRRNHPELRSYILRAVRVTGAGVLRQEGHADQPFSNGAILVEKFPQGEVRVFELKDIFKHFERANGALITCAEEIGFQTPEKKPKVQGNSPRRAA